ncbi:hypothetical protein CF651_26175 [Paenibacillus rigui]|uniref:Uncharacterized protein n=1 Tax=Paenibacillus rigui TaxID=554312 RepID=A0A229UJ07_9BACL|nr:hypothetical protein CF651_26175 [Paenibacillus rigui]
MFFFDQAPDKLARPWIQGQLDGSFTPIRTGAAGVAGRCRFIFTVTAQNAYQKANNGYLDFVVECHSIVVIYN